MNEEHAGVGTQLVPPTNFRINASNGAVSGWINKWSAATRNPAVTPAKDLASAVVTYVGAIAPAQLQLAQDEGGVQDLLHHAG